MGYNSASTKDICETFASLGKSSRLGHRMLPTKFCSDPLWLPWQQNLGQKWAITRLLLEIFARSLRPQGISVEPSNTANEILRQPTLVAMATKFGTKKL